MKNLNAVLEAAGTAMDNVVKVNVFIADMKDFSAMNEVYTQYFGEQKPCRTYAVILPHSSQWSWLTSTQLCGSEAIASGYRCRDRMRRSTPVSGKSDCNATHGCM